MVTVIMIVMTVLVLQIHATATARCELAPATATSEPLTLAEPNRPLHYAHPLTLAEPNRPLHYAHVGVREQQRLCQRLRSVPDVWCKALSATQEPPNVTLVSYDPSSEHISGSRNNYALSQYRILRRERQPSDITVLDIGANIGTFTLSAASLGLDVHAFEPLPSNAARLRLSLWVNGMEDRVSLHGHGIGMTRSTFMLFVNPNNKVLKSDGIIVSGMDDPIIRPEWKRGGTLTPITTIPLDEVALPTTVFAVKIDVEGFESFVVQGGKRFFSTVRPRLVFMEINAALWDSRSSTSGWLSVAEVLRFFVDLQYDILEEHVFAADVTASPLTIDAVLQRKQRIEIVFRKLARPK